MTKTGLLLTIISLILGFLLGMEYKAYQLRSVFSETISNFSTKEGGIKQPEEIEDTINYVDKGINDEVELATIKITVNSIEETQILNGGYGTPAMAKENTKFIVVNLNITNITNSDFTFFPDDGIRLLDNKDRLFTTYGESIGKIDNYLNVRKLAPGIPETGNLVYEIPADSESYSLVIGKGGTNETYRFILK